MTKNGVVYELYKSPYVVTRREITYFFSSLVHKEKFLEQLEQNRVTINNSLSNRFSLTVVFTLLADIVLYSKVETRGFLINYKGEYYKCKNHLKLIGENLTNQS